MHYHITSQHHLPTHPDVPLSSRRLADEVAQERLKEDQLVGQRRSEKAREIIQSVARGVRDLIGDYNYVKFRHYLWSERNETRNLLQPPDGFTLDVSVLSRDRKDRANAYLQNLGVAPERLSELVQAGRRKLEDVLPNQTHSEHAKVYTSARFLDLFGDLQFDKSDLHAFTTFQPPFGGWQAGWHFDNFGIDEFRGGHHEFIDAAAGLAGHEVTIDNNDASDLDLAEAVADAQIAFWFQPAVTGIVEVVLEVQNFQAAHHLCTDDEWGWSDSKTNQNNFLMMHVLHPNVAGPSFADASLFQWKTDESECVDRQFIPTGASFFTRLLSPGAVPVGEPVLIRAGTRTVSRSLTNDVEIHSSSRFQYLFKSVAVRIAP